MKVKEILDLEKDRIVSLKDIIRRNDKTGKSLPLDAKAINKILGGGFRQGLPYVVFGESKTGKTQLAHQICTQTFAYFSQTRNHSQGKYTLYFDTENTFRPERIRELSQLKGLNYKTVLKSIEVSKILSNSALLISMKKAARRIKSQSIKVMIVDTINNHFRSERGKKGGLFNKLKQDFLEILQWVLTLTVNYNLITILTAQVTPSFISDDPIRERPVGDQYLNHFFSEFIYLNRKDKNKCYAHLVNSTFLPEKRLLYALSSQGIEDYTI